MSSYYSYFSWKIRSGKRNLDRTTPTRLPLHLIPILISLSSFSLSNQDNEDRISGRRVYTQYVYRRRVPFTKGCTYGLCFFRLHFIFVIDFLRVFYDRVSVLFRSIFVRYRSAEVVFFCCCCLLFIHFVSIALFLHWTKYGLSIESCLMAQKWGVKWESDAVQRIESN